MKAETLADILFVLLTLAIVTGCAMKASAGAPGDSRAAPIIIPASAQADRATLSPAEIRNAAIVRADLLEERGQTVDRSVIYGIGLEP